ITHGISIQAHGWGGITQSGSCATCAAITISVTTSDPVMLNGLILDGAGTGQYGIYITSGLSVQILNSVVRHFQNGIFNSTNTTIANSVIANNSNFGVNTSGPSITWLAKTVISGNTTGVRTFGTVYSSYGDNYINDNMNPVQGNLTPVQTQ